MKIFLASFLSLFIGLFCLTAVVLAVEMGPPAPTYDPNANVVLPSHLSSDATGDVTRGASARDQISGLAGNLIKTVLGIIGSIALIIFIYAGFRYMTARGNAEQSKAAAATMVWAVLGLAMIFFSYIILDFIFKAFKPV